VLIVGAVAALIFGYSYLFIIRKVGGSIIWVCFAIIILGLTAGGLWTYFFKRHDY
jgi:hypothetical protein